MDPLEERLKAMRLAEPSANLDRRMNEAFAVARRSVDRDSRGWWIPLAATAALACAAFLLISPRTATELPPESQSVVYHVEPKGMMRAMLLGDAGDAAYLPPFVAGSDTPSFRKN